MIPKIGDKIYVATHLYIGHGEDDMVGGVAEVIRVEEGISAGKPAYFVYVKEHPGNGYNWEFLEKDQEKLKTRFGKSSAYPDPDYHDYGERW